MALRATSKPIKNSSKPRIYNEYFYPVTIKISKAMRDKIASSDIGNFSAWLRTLIERELNRPLQTEGLPNESEGDRVVRQEEAGI